MAPSMTGLLVPLPEGFVGWDEDESRSAVIFVDNGKPYDVEKDLPEAWLVEKVRDVRAPGPPRHIPAGCHVLTGTARDHGLLASLHGVFSVDGRQLAPSQGQYASV